MCTVARPWIKVSEISYNAQFRNLACCMHLIKNCNLSNQRKQTVEVIQRFLYGLRGKYNKTINRLRHQNESGLLSLLSRYTVSNLWNTWPEGEKIQLLHKHEFRDYTPVAVPSVIKERAEMIFSENAYELCGALADSCEENGLYEFCEHLREFPDHYRGCSAIDYLRGYYD